MTAAAQGIGQASAIALADAGAQVCATDVNGALLATAFTGIPHVTTAVLDVRDKAAIQRVFGTLPRLDVLFNCAGVVHNGSALAATDDELMFAFELNVRAQLWAIQAAVPKMQAAGGGSIINMAKRLLEHQGLAQPLRLWHHQGGGARPDQKRRGRFS